MSVVIWTTTPWTLPANRAVALNPELEYAVVQADLGQGKERLVLAEALLKDVMLRYECEHYQVVAYCRGQELEHLKLAHPFYDREVPIILADHVTLEAGTGDSTMSEWEWIDAIHEVLKKAVERRRAIADVPVGILLSGGLDSSLLVALLAEAGLVRLGIDPSPMLSHLLEAETFLPAPAQGALAVQVRAADLTDPAGALCGCGGALELVGRDVTVGDVLDEVLRDEPRGSLARSLVEFLAEPGETVLIHAIGSGVGLAALMLAKDAGMRVVGTSRTADKIEKALELGLDIGGHRFFTKVPEIEALCLTRLPTRPSVARARRMTSLLHSRLSCRYLRTAGKTPLAPQVGAVAITPPAAFSSDTARAYAQSWALRLKSAP